MTFIGKAVFFSSVYLSEEQTEHKGLLTGKDETAGCQFSLVN
jgi:hypothetical protein